MQKEYFAYIEAQLAAGAIVSFPDNGTSEIDPWIDFNAPNGDYIGSIPERVWIEWKRTIND